MSVKRKAKIIPGIVLMTLSSLAVAATTSGSPASSGNKHPASSLQASKGGVALPAVASQAAPSVPARAPGMALNLRENHLLSQDLSAWAKLHGMHPLWNSNRDYLIYSSIRLDGKTRDEVLDKLGQLFRSENYGLVIRLYEKNNVLVIDGQ